eukprot:5302447-Pyramimonas_sp.AAC.1
MSCSGSGSTPNIVPTPSYFVVLPTHSERRVLTVTSLQISSASVRQHKQRSNACASAGNLKRCQRP